MLTLGWAFAGVLSFLFYSWFTQRLRRWLRSKIVNRLTSLPREREWTVGRVSLGLTLSSQLWRWKFLPLKGVNISSVDRIHVSSSFWFTKHWVESNLCVIHLLLCSVSPIISILHWPCCMINFKFHITFKTQCLGLGMAQRWRPLADTIMSLDPSTYIRNQVFYKLLYPALRDPTPSSGLWVFVLLPVP